MPLYVSVLAALLMLACGSDQEQAPAQQESVAVLRNEPPVIRSVQLLPSEPTSSQPISVAVRAHDPEARPLSIHYTWHRNGQIESRGQRNTLPAETFSRGDRVHVVVRVSDGEFESSETSPVIRVRNSPPQILSLDLEPKKAKARQPIVASLRSYDADGDELRLEYRWYVNDKQLPDATGEALPAGTVRREDRVEVSAAAHDGATRGDWARSAKILVRNSAPQITSRPTYRLSADNTYEYMIEASDPDDDRPLRYTLDEGPPGMEIDLVSGRVSWRLPADAAGKYPVEISVSDPHGGRSKQTYVLDLRWETPPANSR